MLSLYNISQTDQTSFIEILSYNSKNDEIEGQYQVKSWPLFGSSPADSILLSEGTFRTKIK